MPIERKKFENNYVVYVTNNGDGTYTFGDEAVKFIDRQDNNTEKPYLGNLNVPQGNVDFATVVNFMDVIKYRPIYNNTLPDVLKELLSNRDDFTLTLKEDQTGKVTYKDKNNTKTLFESAVSAEKDKFDVTAYISDEVSITDTVTKPMYYALLAHIIKVWSDNQLRVHPKVR